MASETIGDFTVPDGAIDGVVWKNAGQCVFVAAKPGRVGDGRNVEAGDFLTEKEAGNGESHGTVYRLPADSGIVALLRAALARVDALERLVVEGSPEEIRFEAEQIAKARG